MEEYERTLTAPQIAEATLNQCFYTMDNRIYLNYSKILGIFETIHQVLTIPYLPEHKGHAYRHLIEADIAAIYHSYKAIADQSYKVTVNSSGSIVAMPDDHNIPQPVFGIIAEILSLVKKD